MVFAKTGGGSVCVVEGVVEVHGGWVPQMFKVIGLFSPLKSGIAAITLGHVIVGQSQLELDRCRAHEHVHVRQYERWGLFFLPAYLIASFVALVKGDDPYFDNAFEKEAFAVDHLNL